MLGTARTAPPMAVLAPVTDRSGNVYVLAGSRDLTDVNVFVARKGGGVYSGCHITKGDSLGAIGWVGFTDTRQFYWSGGSLVAVNGANGDCRAVLDRDPATGTELSFRGVFPWVNDTPSKTTLNAFIQSPSDPVPYMVTVDLNARISTVSRPFTPDGAANVVIHGTGANAKLRNGVVLLSYERNDKRSTFGRFYDEEGELSDTVSIAGAGDVPAYGIRGFLQESDQGLVAGLTSDNRVVLFDASGGRIVAAPNMEPGGIHYWDGSLYLVGMANNRPVLAPIDDSGQIGAVVPWASSSRIAGNLGTLDIVDDRVPPARTFAFRPARNAIGPFPLVTEQSSFKYADGTTLMLLAGPTFGEDTDAFTQIAVTPVGVSYP